MPDESMMTPRLLPVAGTSGPPSQDRRAVAAMGVAAALAVGGGIGASRWPVEGPSAPYAASDLGPLLVTPINASDPAALRRAFSHLRLDAPARERLRAGLATGATRLGLIAFWDDAAPDGDAVAVTGAGFTQRVVLGKHLTPVVTPYAPGAPVAVTAVYDGGGTVTVAVMTRSGPTPLKRLLVGDSVEVATP